MIILSVQNIKKAFGGNVVLENASLTLQEGQRMGLVGVNGCGKTTLMKIIMGIERYDEGAIAMQKGLEMGYLAQQGMVTPGLTVLQELEKVFDPVVDMEKRLRELEHQIAAAAADADQQRILGNEYAALTEKFEAANGYGWKSAVQGVLAGLGFTKEQQSQEAMLLSGGERTRLCLGRLLLQKPGLLLLDEPTNHLDLSAIAWLQDYLNAYKGTVLIISHDRYFMDQVCDCMSELLLGTVEQYEGNYTAYSAQRAQRFESRMKAYLLQQKEIKRQEAIIERYRSFNREKSIKAAESKEKRLAKVERLDKPQDERSIHFRFDVRRRTGEDVLMVKNLCVSFDRLLFENVNIHLKAGDRVALIGPNGVGKSTLFHCLTGQLHPDTGTVRLGANVDVGYYDQHQAGLTDTNTVLDEVWNSFPRMEQYEIRGALGLFLFTGEDVFEPISTLSGGEKGRVALTKLMLRQDNLLLMDEPTNHLDMDSREVLEDALESYPGTILAISHDRYFINRFATKVMVLTEQGIQTYQGNYDDYLAALNRGVTATVNEGPEKTQTQIVKEKKLSREAAQQAKEQKQRIQAIETAIDKQEQLIKELEAQMALPETYQDPQKAQAAAKAYRQAQEKQAELYEQWENEA